LGSGIESEGRKKKGFAMRRKRKQFRNSYWKRDCGCLTFRDMREASDEALPGQCFECSKKRIGEAIRFLRFGKPPSSGKSFDYRDKRAERGVSVYELGPDGKPILQGWHFGITERPAYLGKGRIVGFGSDGEPVVKILGKLKRTKYAENRGKNPRLPGKRGKSRRFVWKGRYAVPRTIMTKRSRVPVRYLRRKEIAVLRKQEKKRFRRALRTVKRIIKSEI